MPNPIRVGLVGADAAQGSWSTVAHIPAMRAVPNLELAAVCTRRQASAKAAADAFGIERHYDDIHKLVQGDVDMIAVIVKVPGHFDAVKAAVEAGKHVYCEWPLGGTLQQTQEMADLCRQHGVVGAVGLQGRHDPHLGHIRQLHDSGWFGALESVDMSMQLQAAPTDNPSPSVPGASMFAIVGGHTLDPLHYIFGPLQSITATVEKAGVLCAAAPSIEPGHLDETADTIKVQARLASGARVDAHISEAPGHPPGWKLRVQGSEGTLEATSPMLPQIAPIAMRGAKAGQRYVEITPPDMAAQILSGAPAGPPRNIAIAYSHMVAAVRDGTRFRADFQDACDVHRLLCSIQEASDNDAS